MADQESIAEPIAVDATAAAKLVGMSRAAWYAAWSAGLTPAGVKIGRARRWSIVELAEWIASGAPPRSQWAARQAVAASRQRTIAINKRIA